MRKADWSKAPDGAEWFANADFYRLNKGEIEVYINPIDAWRKSLYKDKADLLASPTYERKPDHIVNTDEKVWPDESRISNIGQNGGDGMHYDEFREEQEPVARLGEGNSKYNRDIVGLDGTKTTVDVYRVLDAFKTESAAIDHAVKKLLCAGIRHQKDRKQDLEEAIKSIQAELLLMSQR